MTDAQFIAHLREMDTEGHSGLTRMRDFLKANGGISRVIALLPIKKPRKERSASLEIDGFAEWYAAYPRKVARGEAARAYIAARRQVSGEVLLAGAKRYAGQVAGADPKYVAHPASWLRAGRWADEYPVAVLPSEQQAEDVKAWIQRLELFYCGGEDAPAGTWSQKWGPTPDQEGNHVPDDARRTYDSGRAQKIAPG